MKRIEKKGEMDPFFPMKSREEIMQASLSAKIYKAPLVNTHRAVIAVPHEDFNRSPRMP
jgi:hypothetical protein